MRTANLDNLAADATDEEKLRFWAKVIKTETCWLYGYTNVYGYGRHSLRRTQMQAHRVAKIWQTGAPRPGAFACHLCRNKACVRPDHLYWGDAKSNGADKVRDLTGRSDRTRGNNHSQSKLTEDDVRKIWFLMAVPHASMNDVAALFGVGQGSIQAIVSKKTWAFVTDNLPPLDLRQGQRGQLRGIHHKQAKLDDDKVRNIRRMSTQGATAYRLAKEYNVSHRTIINLLHRKTWKHVA